MGRVGGSVLVFVGVFISALVGLLFAPTIADEAASVANNTTGIASTLYNYMPVFYALLLVGMMIGSLYRIFKGR
jgi:ABC-type dipeptide/oligopeptide/nickel transport system permease component